MIAAAVASPTAGGEQKKWLLRGCRFGQEERALAEVVQQQRWQHKREPRHANRALSKVSHVGVQRLAARDHQKDRAEHGEPVPPMVAEERECVSRIDRRENDRLTCQGHEPEHRDDGEPRHHDRAKQSPDTMRAVALDREHGNQNHNRDRHDVRIEQRCRELEPLDGSENGDRRSDHAVAVEQRRTEYAHQDESRPVRAAPIVLRQQSGQRQNATFTLVVGTHHDGDVLDRDHQQQRVDDERQDAQHVLVRHGH
jgi:hypothetical protein